MACGHGDRNVVEGGPPATRIHEPDALHLERRRRRPRRHHPRTVGDGNSLGVDGVDPSRGAQGVGELAPDLGDLPDGDERRHGEQRQQRKHAGVEAAGGDERGTRRHHGQAAEAGGHFLKHGLARQILQKGQARLHVRARPGGEADAAGAFLLEGDDLGQPLNGVDGVRVHLARRLARP